MAYAQLPKQFLEEQASILQQAEQQFKSGLLSREKYVELMTQVQELYKLQAMQMNARTRDPVDTYGGRTESSCGVGEPSSGRGWLPPPEQSVPLPAPSATPLFPAAAYMEKKSRSMDRDDDAIPEAEPDIEIGLPSSLSMLPSRGDLDLRRHDGLESSKLRSTNWTEFKEAQSENDYQPKARNWADFKQSHYDDVYQPSFLRDSIPPSENRFINKLFPPKENYGMTRSYFPEETRSSAYEVNRTEKKSSSAYSSYKPEKAPSSAYSSYQHEKASSSAYVAYKPEKTQSSTYSAYQPEKAPSSAYSAYQPEKALSSAYSAYQPEKAPSSAYSADQPEKAPSSAYIAYQPEKTTSSAYSAYQPEKTPSSAYSADQPEKAPSSAYSAYQPEKAPSSAYAAYPVKAPSSSHVFPAHLDQRKKSSTPEPREPTPESGNRFKSILKSSSARSVTPDPALDGVPLVEDSSLPDPAKPDTISICSSKSDLREGTRAKQLPKQFLEEQANVVRYAEEQLKSGMLTEELREELMLQLQELYTLQKAQTDIQKGRGEPSSFPAGSSSPIVEPTSFHDEPSSFPTEPCLGRGERSSLRAVPSSFPGEPSSERGETSSGRAEPSSGRGEPSLRQRSPSPPEPTPPPSKPAASVTKKAKPVKKFDSASPDIVRTGVVNTKEKMSLSLSALLGNMRDEPKPPSQSLDIHDSVSMDLDGASNPDIHESVSMDLDGASNPDIHESVSMDLDNDTTQETESELEIVLPSSLSMLPTYTSTQEWANLQSAERARELLEKKREESEEPPSKRPRSAEPDDSRPHGDKEFRKSSIESKPSSNSWANYKEANPDFSLRQQRSPTVPDEDRRSIDSSKTNVCDEEDSKSSSESQPPEDAQVETGSASQEGSQVEQPPKKFLEAQANILHKAEQLLKSGMLNKEQHAKLMSQLLDVCKLEVDAEKELDEASEKPQPPTPPSKPTQPPAPAVAPTPSPSESKSIPLPTGPGPQSTPLPASGGAASSSLPTAHVEAIPRAASSGLPAGADPAVPVIPAVPAAASRPATSRILDRWSKVREDGLHHLPPHVSDGILTQSPCELDLINQLWIGNKAFFMRIGSKKKVRFDKESFEIRIDISGEVYFDKRMVYQLAHPPASVKIGEGENANSYRVFYQGPQRRIWLNGIPCEVRYDAPPLTVDLGGSVHDLHANSFTQELVIDGKPVAKIGEPPKEINVQGVPVEVAFFPKPRNIRIDGKACQLRLEYPIPVIVIDKKPHGVCFKGPDREVLINDQCFSVKTQEITTVRTRGPSREHKIGLLGPGHEFILDGRTYDIKFGGTTKTIRTGTRVMKVRFPGGPPELEILDAIPIDPLTGKLMLVPANHPASEIIHGPQPGSCNAVHLPFDPAGPSARLVAPLPRGTPLAPLGTPITPATPPEGLQGMGMSLLQRAAQEQQRQLLMMQMMASQMGGPANLPSQSMMEQLEIQRKMMIQMLTVQQLQQMQQLKQQLAAVTPMPVASGSKEGQGQGKGKVLDVNKLLTNLQKTGIIGKYGQDAKPDVIVAKKPVQPVPVVPDLTAFQVELLKTKYEGVIEPLYLDGLQCASCARRFPSEEQTKYQQHLDWHFKQNKLVWSSNKRSKVLLKKSKCRPLFFELSAWLDFTKADPDEEAEGVAMSWEADVPSKLVPDQVAAPAAPAETQRRPFSEHANSIILWDNIHGSLSTYHGPICEKQWVPEAASLTASSADSPQPPPPLNLHGLRAHPGYLPSYPVPAPSPVPVPVPPPGYSQPVPVAPPGYPQHAPVPPPGYPQPVPPPAQPIGVVPTIQTLSSQSSQPPPAFIPPPIWEL